MPVDRGQFRQVMGHFATGVTIVTTSHNGQLAGLTANSFSSVSLDPVLVLVCVDKKARSHDMLLASGAFAVNILDTSQVDLSDRFAGRTVPDPEKFDGVAFHRGTTGAPLIDGSLAYLDCRVAAHHDAGDHTIVVGEVVDCGVSPGHADSNPLLFFRGKYKSFEV